MSALNRLGSPPERAIDWASRAEAEAFTKDAQRAEAEARAEATPTAEQAAIEGREESVATERPRPFCVLDSAAATLPLHCRYIYRHITAVLDSASPLWLQAEVHALVLRCVEGLLHGLELSLPQLLQAPAPTPPCRHD